MVQHRFKMFQNGRPILEFQNGAAPFENGADSKMGHNKYTIDLKYQKVSEMHTSNALSRLHNFTDTPDQKDVIPLNFLQHLTPHYIEHSYSHLVENLYAHKTKMLDATTVKQKHGRPPKPKPQIPSSKPRTLTAAKNLTA